MLEFSSTVLPALSLYLKKLVKNSNIPPTYLHRIVKFAPLVAEIGSVVWGTPANFNGFIVLAVLLHGTLVVSVSQTLLR